MANEEVVINTVRSYSIGMIGRSLNQARSNNFIIDEPAYYEGGLGQALGPAEAFLSGISSCGVLLIQGQAAKNNIPFEKVEITIQALRDKNDMSWFKGVDMKVDVTGPSEEQARELVSFYQEH